MELQQSKKKINSSTESAFAMYWDNKYWPSEVNLGKPVPRGAGSSRTSLVLMAFAFLMSAGALSLTLLMLYGMISSPYCSCSAIAG